MSLSDCSSAGLDVWLRHRRDRGVDASHHHPCPQAQRQDGRASPQRGSSLAAPRLKDAGSEALFVDKRTHAFT